MSYVTRHTSHSGPSLDLATQQAAVRVRPLSAATEAPDFTHAGIGWCSRHEIGAGADVHAGDSSSAAYEAEQCSAGAQVPQTQRVVA
jgi:hypothetical protein